MAFIEMRSRGQGMSSTIQTLFDWVRNLESERTPDVETQYPVLRNLLLRQCLGREWGKIKTDPEEVVDAFLVDWCLADDWQNLKQAGKICATPADFALYLKRSLIHFSLESRPSIRLNKKRQLGKLLRSDAYQSCPDWGQEVYAPAEWTVKPPSGGQPPPDPAALALAHPGIQPVLGDKVSSQLPVIVSTQGMRELVGWLFERVGTPLHRNVIFAFIVKVAHLDSYDRIFLLNEVEDVAPEGQETGEPPSALFPDPTPPIDLDEKKARQAAMEFWEKQPRLVQECYLFRLGGGGMKEWFRSRGVASSHFYAKPWRDFCSGLKELALQYPRIRAVLVSVLLDERRDSGQPPELPSSGR